MKKMHATKTVKFQNADVAEVFANYPSLIRENLLRLRNLIFQVASETKGVGKIEEVLRWGQPSYITPESKSGSTIRIDQNKSMEGEYAIFFHCQTDLISSFKSAFPKTFSFEGNRSIIFRVEEQIPEKELKHCVGLALTYHLNRKKGRSPKNGEKFISRY